MAWFQRVLGGAVLLPSLAAGQQPLAVEAGRRVRGAIHANRFNTRAPRRTRPGDRPARPARAAVGSREGNRPESGARRNRSRRIHAAAEPSYFVPIVLVWCIPFLAFFLGIVIRKEVLPGKDSPPLRKHLLMGVPVSLVVVSSLITGIHEGIKEHLSTYIFTLGVLMEHGMLVSETLVRHLEKLTGMSTGEERAGPVRASFRA